MTGLDGGGGGGLSIARGNRRRSYSRLQSRRRRGAAGADDIFRDHEFRVHIIIIPSAERNASVVALTYTRFQLVRRRRAREWWGEGGAGKKTGRIIYNKIQYIVRGDAIAIMHFAGIIADGRRNSYVRDYNISIYA